MASPHVAGVAALYLGTFPDAVPNDVSQFIYGQSTKGIISLQCPVLRPECDKSPNALLFLEC